MRPYSTLVSMPVHISPAVLERFPHYKGVIIYAHNLENKPCDQSSNTLLEQAETQVRAHFSDLKLTDHPHIAAWREAYSAFGIKPNKMQNSAEALIGRVLKGNQLPRINWLADVYNAISLHFVLPIGGEDLDNAVGAQRLELATGTENFDTNKDGAPFTDHPQPGEVIWRDDVGVTCRAWNWRQCVRTRLTEQTKNAYFVLDSLEPYPPEQLEAACAELEAWLRQLSPHSRFERHRF
jgi:DNA/RNA-binding domain of Phe-tRNA-synthetase-like protein